nr:hypothetical protein [Tanacetum cinerariifolium]
MKDVCMDDEPSSLKKWKDKYFLIDRRAILDYLTWRHSCSCIYDDLLTDGYDQNDVERLFARLICFREMWEEVLVRSGLISMWFNKECDLVFRRIDDNAEMSIYNFMTLPSWSDAKVVEESHNLSSSLPDRQTEGKYGVDLTDFYAKIKNSLQRDEGTSVRAALAFAPAEPFYNPLGGKHQLQSQRPASHVGTLVHASSFRRNISLEGMVQFFFSFCSFVFVFLVQLVACGLFGTAASGHVGRSRAVVLRRQINLTLFRLAPGPYHMPYPYEGISSPLYTIKEWDGIQAPESYILSKDIFKDPDVCNKALDQTITHAELRRTEYLLPLELSNRVNVLSALLVSHGYELNSHYTNLVSSRARLQEKFDKKNTDVRLLCSEVTFVDDKLEKLQRIYDDLGQENRELCSQRDAASEEVRKLQSQLTDAKAASVGLIRKLLSSAEFYAALARVASLGINYGVERGLRMGCTDAEFEMVVQKVFNFQVSAKANFDKAFVGFPTTQFPFLGKVAAVARAIHRRAFMGGRRLCASSLPLANLCAYFSPINAYYFIQRFRFSLSASLFSSSDPCIVLLVGMPISVGTTASARYARLNGVSPLLVLGVVLYLACYGPMHQINGPRIFFLMYSWIGVIQVLVSSLIIALTSSYPPIVHQVLQSIPPLMRPAPDLCSLDAPSGCPLPLCLPGNQRALVPLSRFLDPLRLEVSLLVSSLPGMLLQPLSSSRNPSVGNFIIEWMVDATALDFLTQFIPIRGVAFNDYEFHCHVFHFSLDLGRLGCWVPRMAPNVEVNLRGLLGLGKSDLNDDKY